MAPSRLPDGPRLLAALEQWVEAGALRALDLALTGFVAEHGSEPDAAVLLAIALASERNGHGNVCLDLAGALSAPDRLLGRLRDDEPLNPRVRAELIDWLATLSLPDWVDRLGASAAVSALLYPTTASPSDVGARPFVLAGTSTQPLLYLRRYWHYEQQIRQGILQRLTAPVPVDEGRLRSHLNALFATEPAPDWQRIACGLAARHAFFILTGGPGTGKTSTVVRLLALLQGLTADAQTHPLRIELAAPTGKAAARLTEAIRSQVGLLPEQYRSRDDIPTEVKTLHRLFGSLPNSRHFRHHRANPLPADVVVVDEASMVDVEMMAHLMDALRPQARLVLIGDKDQLSSVEAGAVLGDLCQRAEEAHYRTNTAAWVLRVTGHAIPDGLIDDDGQALDQAIVMLRKSYRFSDEGGIGALAKRVNQGNAAASASRALDDVLALFDASQAPDLGVILRQPLRDSNDAAFAALILDSYEQSQSYLRRMRDAAPGDGADQAQLNAWAAEVLEAQKGFQLLTPLRQGPWGVEGLNQRIIELLKARTSLLRPPTGEPGSLDASGSHRHWFAGRPVLITHNDYGLNLMNGDIGVTLSVPDGTAHGRLRVAFPAPDGGVRWVLPSRLQHVETVFAMTVHKSQGSEFAHAALVLPDTSSPVLTRELLYTAITRAKQRLTLLYRKEQVLKEALQQQVQRVSGLRELGHGAEQTVGRSQHAFLRRPTNGAAAR